MGENVLVTWDDAGTATVATPPAGMRVETLHAITPDGSVVVGVLSQDDPGSPFQENWAPFLWSAADGFVVIPENGLEQYYDLSEAVDVSDDGSTVVGRLRPSIQGPGSPPPVGFIWTRTDGLLIINDLLHDSGLSSPTGIYSAFATSSDGLRVLGNGDPDGGSFDTNAVILQLAR
jgi:hypothetical protein